MNPYEPVSIESILAEEERVPVRIRFLEERQDVPYWIAKVRICCLFKRVFS